MGNRKFRNEKVWKNACGLWLGGDTETHRSQLSSLPSQAKHLTVWWLSFSVYMTGIWICPPLLFITYILGVEVESHNLSEIYCRVLLPTVFGYYFIQLLISVCIYVGFRINMPQTCRRWIWRPALSQILAWEKSSVVAPGMEKSKVQRSCTEPVCGRRARIIKTYIPDLPVVRTSFISPPFYYPVYFSP